MFLPDGFKWSERKKVFFVGAMGTGKTEISINYAIGWGSFLKDKISLIDFDMVKPLFRLRSIRNSVTNTSVEVMTPPEPYGYADFPIISPQMDSRIRDKSAITVVDMGGEANGARMAGRFHGIVSPDEVDFFYVYNGNRPGADNDADTLSTIDSIRNSAGFPLTGIVHNSHLMGESSEDTLLSHMDRARVISEMSGIPISFHCIREDLYSSVSKKTPEQILPLKIYNTPEWLQ
ncbi:MAG: hypothetical protein LWY06_17155 [Firmicutes bacterium]|nr:hypothetical protein [Bacillota bacterium]